LVISLVSIFGDADDGEPKQVLRLELAQPAKANADLQATGEGGPLAAVPPSLLPAPVRNPPRASTVALVGDQALMEPTSIGPLPRIADDGRKPMSVYGRAYDKNDRRPKVAIVVGGLGVGKAITDAALERLPPAVTLAFTPYGQTLAEDVSAARTGGHEVLLEMPLDSYEDEHGDLGPFALRTGADAKNKLRLRWLMSRVTGYAGLISAHGDRFLASKDDVALVLGEATRRGLFFVEGGDSDDSVARDVAADGRMAFVRADAVVGRSPTREAIAKEFDALERLAKTRGAAIGVTSALPVTVDRVSAWAAELDAKGIALVPASALAGVTVLPPVAIAPVEPRHSAARPSAKKPTPVRLSAKPRTDTKAKTAPKPRMQARTTTTRKPTSARRVTTTATPAPAAPASPPPEPAPPTSTTAAPHP
jgi:hypothetical protein